jgi:putative transposase
MPRRKRVTPAGVVFHAMNRAAKKSRLFDSTADYHAFQQVVVEALSRFNVAFYSYIIMPTHFHFVLSSDVDRRISEFMHWLETTHSRRWALAKGVDGQGAVYQGRFKAIPIQTERHFLWVCRYVERNALRANLVERAEDWRWSSLWQRRTGAGEVQLSQWPLGEPLDWIARVNTPQTDSELEAFRRAVNLGRPFGDAAWLETLGHHIPRPRGRPARCAKVSSTNDPRPHLRN